MQNFGPGPIVSLLLLATVFATVCLASLAIAVRRTFAAFAAFHEPEHWDE